MSKKTNISAKHATLCVSSTEAKATLRIAGSDLDTEVDDTLAAAVDLVEHESQRALRISYTITETYDGWPCEPIRFDWQPVKSITSIKYYDTADSQQTVSSSNYRLLADSDGASVLEFDDDYSLPSIAVRGDAVEVAYTAGYADIASVPDAAKFAVRLKLRELFGDLTERELKANTQSYDSLLGQIQWGAYR